MRLLSVLLLWASLLTSATSKTLNPVVVENANENLTAAAVHENNLIFKRTDTRTDMDELWAYDPVTQSSARLAVLSNVFDPFGQGDDVVSHDGRVYYYQNFDREIEPSEIHFTDLGADSGVLLNPDQVSLLGPFFFEKGDLLFTQSFAFNNNSFEQRLVLVGTTELSEYPAPVLSDQFCAFSEDNLVFFSENPDQSASLSQVTFTGATPLIDSMPPPFVQTMLQTGDTCVIHLRLASEEEVLYTVSRPGEFVDLSEIQEFGDLQIREIVELNDRIYVVGSEYINGPESSPVDTIKRMSTDYQSFDRAYHLEEPVGPFGELIAYVEVVDDHIFFGHRMGSDPPISSIRILDAELNRLSGPPNINLGPTVFSYPTAQDDVLIQRRPAGQSEVVLLSESPSESARLLQPGIEISSVISDPDSSQAYLASIDRSTNRQTIFALDDAPHINDQITGAFNDPTLESQGVSIHKGTRQNGTQYLFITLYLYRDGNPLWLAGSEDLITPKRAITIDLFEYGGADLFEPGITPQRQSFGSIDLEFTGCDELRAEVTHASGGAALSLTRIDNIEFADVCVD